MKAKELIKKIHDDCVQAVFQCPQCEVDIEDLPYPKTIFALFNFWRKGIDYVSPKNGLMNNDIYPRQVAGLCYNILYNSWYEGALNEFTIRFFEKGEEVMEEALKKFCNDFTWIEKKKGG